MLSSANKVKLLAACPNLALVHTLPSAKTARKLSAACEELRLAAGEPPLGVLVQVNTSGEDSKGGAEPADAAELCRMSVICAGTTSRSSVRGCSSAAG